MRTLIGCRPSGRLHLGHYGSVIKPALDDPEATVMIATLHAPTGDADAMWDQLNRLHVYNVAKQPFNAEVFFKLLAVTPSHLLKAMPQYKSATDKSALMYIYPVLMAHDLVGYDRVLVGLDQKPHIELARDILPRIGLTAPEAIYNEATIKDLKFPDRKMSKSDPATCLFLDDKDYERKIMKANTSDAGRANLETIFGLLGDGDAPEGNQDLKQAIVGLYRDRFVSAGVTE